MQVVEPTYSTFTTAQLARLAVYRAAVAAGFYTDWDGSAESTDTAVLGWLTTDSASSGAGAFPFTTDELERLERCRAAVVAGYYTEQ